MNPRPWWPTIPFLACPCLLLADDQPPYQSDFPPQEFRSRREAVFERIGNRSVAIVSGAPKADGFVVPRQTNEFYHVCGIETPHAYLVLDERDRKTTLFLPPRNPRLESAEGKVLSAEDADLVKRLTGVDAVLITACRVSRPSSSSIPRARSAMSMSAIRRRSGPTWRR